MGLLNLSEAKTRIPEARVGVVVLQRGLYIFSSLYVIALRPIYQVGISKETDIVVDGSWRNTDMSLGVKGIGEF